MKVKELINRLKDFNPEAVCHSIDGQVIDTVMYFETCLDGEEGIVLDKDTVEIY